MKKNTAAPSFTSGSIKKALLAFAGPFMVGILIQNLYGAVDLFVVGKFATTADVSGVTIGSQLMGMATQLIIGIANGVTVLIGLYFGAKKPKDMTSTLGTGIVLFGGTALVITGGYLAAYKLMTTAMQTPEAAVVPTEQYLFACSLGIVFIVGYNVINALLTGLGDSRTPLLFVIVACIINVGLDLLLVAHFHMGALGAAIATTIAQAGSFIFALIYLMTHDVGITLSKKDIRFEPERAKSILRIGGPVAVQNLLVGTSFLFITAIINKMGLAESAAVGVVEKIIGFVFVPMIAMGAAVGTSSAQNLGAGQPDRAKKCLKEGIIIALVPAIIVTVFCQFGGGKLASILTNDIEVIALSANYLRSYIIDIIMVSFVFCINGYLNSCNKSWFTLFHSLLTTFLVRVPLSYLLSIQAETSLFLIGWAAPASTLASIVLCVVFLRRMNKKAQKA